MISTNIRKFNLQYYLEIDTKPYITNIKSKFASGRAKEYDVYNKLFISSYKLDDKGSINTNEEYIDALTVKIQVNKYNTEQGNRAKVEIFNLSEMHRKILHKTLIKDNEIDKQRQIKVIAGYDDYNSQIFKGYITQCYSIRQGNDIVTVIDANANELLNNHSNINFTYKPTTEKTVTEELIKKLPNIKVGYITAEAKNLFKVSVRGRSYSGNLWKMIKENNKDFDIYNDDGVLFILAKNEFFNDKVYSVVLKNSTGLLESPKDNEGFIEVSNIFEPAISLSCLVTIDSNFNKQFNGDYKCIGFQHNITVSKKGGFSEGTTQMKLLYNPEKAISKCEIPSDYVSSSVRRE